MIRILIDGRQLIFTEGFSTDFVRANSIMTRTGDYTYSIDVDLRIPSNAILYAHLTRLNASPVKTGRRAEIWNDNVLLAKGVESVLKVNGYTAKIQILANNSEVNYMFDSAAKIRQMDFGKCETATAEKAKAVLDKYYPEANEAYPVLKIGEDKYNWSDTRIASAGKYEFQGDEWVRPMPYVLFIIDKMMETLGYEIGINNIDKEKYKRLVVIHGYDTIEYARMLPDWTVSQALDEFEKFFNVVFCFDGSRKIVDIVNVDEFYETEGYVYVNGVRVIDEHDKDFEASADEILSSYTNVGYDVPSSEFWTFQHIDKEIYDILRKENLKLNYHHEYKNTDMVIYWDEERKCEWIHWEAGEVPNDDARYKYARIVNQYKDYVSDDNEDVTRMKMIPAETYSEYFTDDHGGHMFGFPSTSVNAVGSNKLSDVIRGGSADASIDTMQVAFYLGVLEFRDIGGGRYGLGYGIPTAACKYYQQHYNVIWTYAKEDFPDFSGDFPLYLKTLTLELCGIYGRVQTELHNSLHVDTSCLYTITFIADRFLDPRMKFVINNRLFYCKQLKYKVENGRMSDEVEGEFYAAK